MSEALSSSTANISIDDVGESTDDVSMEEMAASTADVSIEEMGESTAHGACSAADKEHLSDPNTVGKKQDACGHSAYSIIHGMDESKFVSCVKKDLKISDGCAKCYFGAADYGARHCKMKCLSGWCKKGCLDCTKPYMSSLKKCTGFTPEPAKPCMSEALSSSTANISIDDVGESTDDVSIEEMGDNTANNASVGEGVA